MTRQDDKERRATMATAVGFPVSDQKKETHIAEWIPLAAITRCVRCGGLMVTEQGFECPVWRCVQCGELIDPVILRNRLQNENGPV
jgi:hypothetical protein